MEEQTKDQTPSWLDSLLGAATTITTSYFQGQAQKQSAKVQATVNNNTLETDKQAKLTSTTAKNVLLIIGGTLGLLLAYKTAKKLLK